MACEATPVWVIRFPDGVLPVCSPHLGGILERSVRGGRVNFQILFVTDAAGAKCHHEMAGIQVELKAEGTLGKIEKVIEARPEIQAKASVEVR